jgi:hypothetical protein
MKENKETDTFRHIMIFENQLKCPPRLSGLTESDVEKYL